MSCSKVLMTSGSRSSTRLVSPPSNRPTIQAPRCTNPWTQNIAPDGGRARVSTPREGKATRLACACLLGSELCDRHTARQFAIYQLFHVGPSEDIPIHP